MAAYFAIIRKDTHTYF